MKRTIHAAVMTATVAAVAIALTACSGGGDGGSNGDPATGYLSIGITDGPVDAADQLVLEIHGVELKPKAGRAISIDFAAPRSLDLLELQDGQRAMLLDDEEVPAGDYLWMRLKVAADPDVAGDSYIVIDDSQCELRIPSGDETGLKMIRGFTVGVGSTTDFTADFDLRKSVVRPPGQTTAVDRCEGQAYLLKPVVRLVNNLEVGTLSGTIDPTLVSQQCTAESVEAQVAPGNVYLFGPYETDLPVPDDYDGLSADGEDALASAGVKIDEFGNHVFTIAFVPAGNYVAAYTCDSDQPDIDADAADSPAGADEVVEFAPASGLPVTVNANETSTVDFVFEP
jgi:hypothetical protein